MKYNEINQSNPSQPDTQNTGMAQNQLLKIGQHAVKIENMIADSQEISDWASNKIDLASDYIKKIHNKYLKEFDSDSGLKQNISICGQVLGSLSRVLQIHKVEDLTFTYSENNGVYYKGKEGVEEEIDYTTYRINTFMDEFLALQQ